MERRWRSAPLVQGVCFKGSCVTSRRLVTSEKRHVIPSAAEGPLTFLCWVEDGCHSSGELLGSFSQIRTDRKRFEVLRLRSGWRGLEMGRCPFL